MLFADVYHDMTKLSKRQFLETGVRRSHQQIPFGYSTLLQKRKLRIRSAQVRAAFSVNRELINLYWDIGRRIAERQQKERWGTSVIERLAKDIQRAFPGIKGFSLSNIWRMRAFYLAYTADVENLAQPVRELDGINLPQPVAEIPWGHNVLLIEKIKNPLERLWYAKKNDSKWVEPSDPMASDRKRFV